MQGIPTHGLEQQVVGEPIGIVSGHINCGVDVHENRGQLPPSAKANPGNDWMRSRSGAYKSSR